MGAGKDVDVDVEKPFLDYVQSYVFLLHSLWKIYLVIDIPQEQSSVVGKGNLPVKKLSKEDMGWFQHHTSHSTKQIGVKFCNQLIQIRPSYFATN